MNKAIQDLINLATSESEDIAEGMAMYNVTMELVPEDLVHLTIAECVRLCKENNAFVAADRIKRHFGVN